MVAVTNLAVIDEVFFQLLYESDYPETNLFKWTILQAFLDIIYQMEDVVSAMDFLGSNKFEWKQRRDEICELAFMFSSWMTADLIQQIYLDYTTNKTVRARITEIFNKYEAGIYLYKGENQHAS